jgi:hypothetical protein
MPPKSKGSKWEGDFDAKEHERHFGKQVSGKGRDGKDAKGKGPDPRGDKPGGSGGAAGGGRGSAGTVPRDRLGDGAKRPAGKDQVRGAGGRAGDDEAGGDAPKPGKDAKGKPGKGKGVRIEPHESGEGSRAHFHPEVSADLKGDADYKHHVTEHAKHYAGYLTHKDKDQERGEAHRQAANLHARVGNALHAGGDTKPAPPPMVFGPPGAAGGASPGKDAMGRPLPGAPDGQRNPPGQDSTIGAQRRAGKPAGGAAGGAKGGQGKPGQGGPPMELVGKALYFAKSEVEARDAAGRWTQTESGFEHSSGAKLVRTSTPSKRAGGRDKVQWHLHHKGVVHELPAKPSFDHAERFMGKSEYFGELSKGGERAGHKYTRRERQGDRWVYYYGDKEVRRTKTPQSAHESHFDWQQRMHREGKRIGTRRQEDLPPVSEPKPSQAAQQAVDEYAKLHKEYAAYLDKPASFVYHERAADDAQHRARVERMNHLLKVAGARNLGHMDKLVREHASKSLATLPLGTRRIPLLLVPA